MSASSKGVQCRAALDSARVLFRISECLSGDQLHDERGTVRRFLDVMNCRDVGMIHRREHLRFAFEPQEPIWIAGQRRRQHLDRNVARQFRVARAIDLADAAGAEGRENFIRAKTGADCKGT